MEVLYPRCSGVDVHKDLVVARARCVSEPPVDETRSFATCGFRTMPATDSGACRATVPGHVGPPFRSMPA